MIISKSVCSFIFSMLFITSCDKPENITDVENELLIYIDRFYKEARLRNRHLEGIDLIARFKDEIIFEGNEFCGFGRGDINGRGQASLEMVRSDFCWNTKTDIQRENFVFHELGHALLRRSHSNRLLPNNSFETMMCGGYRICDNYLAYNEFQDYKRVYYLDELFTGTPGTPPEWSLPKQSTSRIYSENFERDTLTIDSLAYTTATSFFGLDTNNILDGNSLLMQSAGEIVNFPIRLLNQNPMDCTDIIFSVDVFPEISNESGLYIALQAIHINANEERIPLQEIVKPLSDFQSPSRESVRLGCIAKETDEIMAYMFFDSGTIGKAYFDNVTISVNE